MIVAWAGHRGTRVRAWECRKSYKDGDDIGAIAVAGTWVSICAVRVVAVVRVSCVEVAALSPCLGEVDRCSQILSKNKAGAAGCDALGAKLPSTHVRVLRSAEQHD